MQQKRILVVDDEQAICDSLKLLLKSNFEVSTAQDGEEALSLIQAQSPDLVLLDVIMPKLDGIETLKTIRQSKPSLPVIMLTATNTVKTAVQAMKYGAADYLSKPFDVEDLTRIIIDTLDLADQNIQKIVESQKIVQVNADFGPLVGRSEIMQNLFTKIKQVAERDTSVLITGESGTGKELVARMIHDSSKRKDGPFVAINCAAIPETLIESEIFGHEKGAFTHAIERRIGHFELADKGTLFLDEIGELNLNVQVKLLRFLQEQEFYRIGKSKPIKVDVRIVCATNQNLDELIKNKTFRQDLFYRINVIGIEVPPLRDRYEDIKFLLEHFTKKFSQNYSGRELNFSPDALEVLVEYPWPGNVRELENVIESLVALAPSANITAEDLPAKLKVKGSFNTLKSQTIEGQLNFDQAEHIFEKEIIIKALKKTNFVQTRAAALLGISRRILKYKMDKLGISENNLEAQSATTTTESIVPE